MDVRDDDAISAGFDRAEAALGPVSVVINNAGVAHRDKATHLARADPA
jgi:NAD(P)-dependent dehydrogenase (short-subunit alcohol dehydrogenase family)